MNDYISPQEADILNKYLLEQQLGSITGHLGVPALEEILKRKLEAIRTPKSQLSEALVQTGRKVNPNGIAAAAEERARLTNIK